MYTLSELILYFFIYAVLGWIWETFYCWARSGFFVYRGLLKGPYCPIYGFGVLLVLFLVIPVEETALELFIFSVIVVTALEYSTGYLLEHVFRVRLWDYDNMPLNIHGRVAIPVSIFWGFCCVLVVKCIQPQVAIFVSWLYDKFGIWLPLLIICIFTVDTVVSLFKLRSFKIIMAFMVAKLNQTKETVHGKLSEVEQLARLEGKGNGAGGRFHGLRSFDKRILNAFPTADIKGIKGFKDTKKILAKREKNKK